MIRLALRVTRADAELVLADLLDLAPGGVEEIELPARDDGGEDIVEYAVYGGPGELPSLPDLQAAAGGALVEVSTSEIPDDWSERWKRFHHPILIEPPAGGASAGAVPALHVRPPWEAPSGRPGVREIAIDPAQAFGTGAHATTRLCLELLLELAASDDARGAVLDVGAGSGVLAIASAKLGYAPVLALDNDAESVRAIVANAAVNGVEVEARRFDLRREMLPWLALDGDGDGVPAVFSAPADSDRREERAGRSVVLANLLLPLLLELADAMPASDPPGCLDLIASGLLREQAEEVAQAFAKRLGLCERARRERGEWVALWLTRARAARSQRAPSP
ncbi:MAG TPA: 50S ribosomal protein L11 methyltransferase [Solirubrobacteraceae bacterium]|nr:50S ribosomal protein L11 methyltransferase [Solirubrobacteraceae bacterium]